MKFNWKKTIAILLCCCLVVGAAGGGVFWYVRSRANSSPVEVEPASMYTTMDWGSENYSSGIATSDYVQEIYAEADKIIKEIPVQEGQEVHVGDVLVQYETTRMELNVERCKNEQQQLEYELGQSRQELTRLQSLKPYVPEPEPEPVPEPEPEPLPENTYEAHDVMDAAAAGEYFAGSGTSEDPYRYLCTSECRFDSAYLASLCSALKEADTGEDESREEGPAPAAVRFEVHEEDNEHGRLLYAWEIDGTTGAMRFLPEETMPEPEPVPEPEIPAEEPEEQYTQEELKDMISAKEEEITNLEYSIKQAQLSLETAQKELEDACVVSRIDGVVKTLTDVDSVIGTDNPFLVVSGENGFYLQGTLNESMLGQISVGDVVTAYSYETGSYYDARIIEISDYPEDVSEYFYGGNPNTSNYAFLAQIEEADGLRNGMWLDITMTLGDDSAGESLFLWKAYILSDDGEKYIYKVGEDGRLKKQTVRTGKTLYGDYIEIKSGLSEEDLIAFPYGKNVRDGAAVKLPEDYEMPMDGEGMEESGQPEDFEFSDGAEAEE